MSRRNIGLFRWGGGIPYANIPGREVYSFGIQKSFIFTLKIIFDVDAKISTIT